jgi:hypothetical protein
MKYKSVIVLGIFLFVSIIGVTIYQNYITSEQTPKFVIHDSITENTFSSKNIQSIISAVELQSRFNKQGVVIVSVNEREEAFGNG